MKAKWSKAVYFSAGVLFPIPLNLLVENINDLRFTTITFGYTFALVILIHAVYLILGAYIGLYNLVESNGVKGRLRVRWPKFALGTGLLTLSLLLRLSYYSPVFTSELARGSDFLRAILSFNDRFLIWFVLAGFLMANAFEKIPLKEEAPGGGPRPDEQADGEQSGV